MMFAIKTEVRDLNNIPFKTFKGEFESYLFWGNLPPGMVDDTAVTRYISDHLDSDQKKDLLKILKRQLDHRSEIEMGHMLLMFPRTGATVIAASSLTAYFVWSESWLSIIVKSSGMGVVGLLAGAVVFNLLATKYAQECFQRIANLAEFINKDLIKEPVAYLSSKKA